MVRGLVSTERMRACNALLDTGLSRNSCTPRRTASSTRERSPCPVSMMIGTFGNGNVPGERTLRTNEGPSMPGISQSSSTISGLIARIASSPWRPSLASWTLVQPIDNSSVRMTLRV